MDKESESKERMKKKNRKYVDVIRLPFLASIHSKTTKIGPSYLLLPHGKVLIITQIYLISYFKEEGHSNLAKHISQEDITSTRKNDKQDDRKKRTHNTTLNNCNLLCK